TEWHGVAGRQFISLLFDDGSGVGGALPPAGGDVLLEGGYGLVHFHGGDFTAKSFQPNGILDLQRLPLRERVRRSISAHQPNGIRTGGFLDVKLDDNRRVEIGVHQRSPRPSSMICCESGATLSP